MSDDWRMRSQAPYRYSDPSLDGSLRITERRGSLPASVCALCYPPSNASQHPFEPDDRSINSGTDTDGAHTSKSNRRRYACRHPEHRSRVDANKALRGLIRKVPWWKTWRLEIIGSILSVAFMTTAIMILWVINDKPRSFWAIRRITPNTFLSRFVTMSKSMMLLTVAEGISQLKWTYFQKSERRLADFQVFDDASRGPLGALKVFWSLKARTLLATIGALLILLALAMDPFAQQVLSFPMRTVEDKSMSTSIGSGYAYEGPAFGTDDTHAEAINDDSAMTGSLFNGLFAPERPTAFQCPTGNCTWPSFESIGLCSTCNEVTGSVVAECRTDRRYPQCNYTTPNGLGFSTDHGPDSRSLNGASMASDVLINSTASGSPKNGYDPATGIVANVSIMRHELSYVSSLSSPMPRFYECEFHWCQQTYPSIRVVNGLLDDETTNSLPLMFPHCLEYWSTVTSPHDSGLWSEASCPGIPNTPENRYYLNSRPVDLPESQVYWVQSNQSNTLAMYLSDIFNQTLVTDEYAEASNNGKPILTAIARELYSLNDGNVTSTIANVATGFTRYIREARNSTLISGSVYTTEVYVKVKWYWLVLPASLVGLAPFFLICSITSSSKEGRHPLKSSALAMLFISLEAPESEEVLEVRTLRQMHEVSEGMSVKLAEDQFGCLVFWVSQPNVSLRFRDPNRSCLSLRKYKDVEVSWWTYNEYMRKKRATRHDAVTADRRREASYS